jgi:hypothetical protein
MLILLNGALNEKVPFAVKLVPLTQREMSPLLYATAIFKIPDVNVELDILTVPLVVGAVMASRI